MLVVEDNHVLRDILLDIVRLQGWQGLGAADFGTAMETLQANEQVTVVVSDFQMPGVNGIELIRAVRRVQPSTATILMTGNPLDLQPDTLEPKPTLLVKPFRLDDFVTTILAEIDRAAVC